MRSHAICLSACLWASLGFAQTPRETLGPGEPLSPSPSEMETITTVRTLTKPTDPTLARLTLSDSPNQTTVLSTASPEAFIGWQPVINTVGGPSTASKELVMNYNAIICAASETYATSGQYAACCPGRGQCIFPTKCTTVYHTDRPTDTTDPGRITCTYSEFAQTNSQWASCTTTEIYNNPLYPPTAPVLMMLGCYSEAASATADPRADLPAPRLYRARTTEEPASTNPGGMNKSEIVAIALVVPMAALTAAAAFWCHWYRRAKRRAERQKHELPGYLDCIIEGRPPAYSAGHESGPDSQGSRTSSREGPRPRSPPPDYAASTENLPGSRRGHDPPQGTEERELGLSPGQESYVLQELDRSAVGNLSRGHGNAEADNRERA